jgi:RNA polymerase sigma-70 factor (ECF subfamily)
LIDLNLIEQCRGGNFNNFRKLVEATSPYAYSVAFRMLGNEDEAKDIVQDTMVTTWQKLGKIKSAEVYKTWLYRIVVNKCYDQMRKRKRNPEFAADEKTWVLLSNSVTQAPGVTLENEELSGIINVLTEKLSSKQKAVFVLCDLEGMTNDEVSEITGINKSSVKANLYHARKSISEKLEKYL